MPKDRLDPEDPLELNAVTLACPEDTTAAMTECFVEEFLRLGHDHRQILALFRNPHYLGMNLALQKCGESFVRDLIGDVFARRGVTVSWPPEPSQRPEPRSDLMNHPLAQRAPTPRPNPFHAR